VDNALLTVSLLGVDAPTAAGECYAPETQAHLRGLLERAGGSLILMRDPNAPDAGEAAAIYRYVWLAHPDGLRLLNEELIKWGYARHATGEPAYTYAPLFAAQAAGGRGARARALECVPRPDDARSVSQAARAACSCASSW
jgi:hypothetical protein